MEEEEEDELVVVQVVEEDVAEVVDEDEVPASTSIWRALTRHECARACPSIYFSTMTHTYMRSRERRPSKASQCVHPSILIFVWFQGAYFAMRVSPFFLFKKTLP